MVRWRLAACAATVLGVAGACASFSTDSGGGAASDGGAGDDGGSCRPPGCSGAVPSACTSGCEKFSFNADPTPDVVGECVNGAVHVKAANTRDVKARLDIRTPAVAYDTVVISGRLSIPVWGSDAGWALELAVDQKTALRLYATPRVDGTVAYDFCASDTSTCGTSQKTIDPPTVMVIRMTKTAIEIEMDCVLVTRLPPIPLPTSTGLTIELGGSAKPTFDATFAEPTVAFE